MDKERDKGTNKTFLFLTALSDCYKDDEERELFNFEKLQLTEDELTDDFTRMLIALHILYERITEDDVDLIEFTHILNRLSLQYILSEKGFKMEE